MYQKPALQSFGNLRDLTLVGAGQAGDGGIAGSGFLDGCTIGCTSRS